MSTTGSAKWFIRFEEYNDHEGETWNWWLQTTNNAEELMKLNRALKAANKEYGFEQDFTLHAEAEPEDVITVLAHYARKEPGRYHPQHTKVSGIFTMPDIADADVLMDALYKGGIVTYFKEDK